jgi:hypothetical protein
VLGRRSFFQRKWWRVSRASVVSVDGADAGRVSNLNRGNEALEWMASMRLFSGMMRWFFFLFANER